MTKEEAIKILREDYCGNRIICELHPDKCNQEECEIWLAIKALETQPDGDTISRQAAVDAAISADMENHSGILSEKRARVIDRHISAVPSAQPESIRTFVELVVRYPDPELCTYKEYKGKPYYSIKYIEKGETYVGYGTYNPEVLSQYLKEYFISSAQPEITPDGTLNVSIDADMASIGRILLSQAGTQRGGLYYKDAEYEIIRCAECKWLQCNMRQDGTLPKGVDEFECRHWCGYCDPMDFCSHAKRRTDG